jgi:hypothetical protein
MGITHLRRRPWERRHSSLVLLLCNCSHMRPLCWPRIAGIILGIFREIPTVHNLPFMPPVPARAWLLVGPAHIHLYIKHVSYLLLHLVSVHSYFSAFKLELVRDRQPPLPVPSMVAGESCACTPMCKHASYLLLHFGSVR